MSCGDKISGGQKDGRTHIQTDAHKEGRARTPPPTSGDKYPDNSNIDVSLKSQTDHRGDCLNLIYFCHITTNLISEKSILYITINGISNMVS